MSATKGNLINIQLLIIIYYHVSLTASLFNFFYLLFVTQYFNVFVELLNSILELAENVEKVPL